MQRQDFIGLEGVEGRVEQEVARLFAGWWLTTGHNYDTRRKDLDETRETIQQHLLRIARPQLPEAGFDLVPAVDEQAVGAVLLDLFPQPVDNLIFDDEASL